MPCGRRRAHRRSTGFTAPIKVGFLGPLSGPYVQNGRDILNGFLLALDEIGYRAGGRPIELIVEDDEAIPAVGLTKARKLVERDNVHLMAGALLSSTGYALAPYIDSMRVPMVYPVVSADDLTQRRRSKWIVRTGLDREPAQPRVRRVRVSHAEAAEGRDDRARLRVRMGVGRRLRADVRGRGRHDRAEDLVSGVGARFRALPGADFDGTSTRCTRWCSAGPRCSSCGSTRSSG